MNPPFETASALALPGIAHGFFGRRGGVSVGPYASLNAGAGSADDAAAVQENRTRIRDALGAAHLICMRQVHSANALAVMAPWTDAWPEADGIATATPGLALCALSADCAPALFADPDARVIGAAHAGWKGALGGVLEATIDAMESLGARRERLIAALGPTISRSSYEIGPEFEERFLREDPLSNAFFAAGPATKRHFDLRAYCTARLERAGVTRIGHVGGDTYANRTHYFSARRAQHDGAHDYGRNCASILLRD